MSASRLGSPFLGKTNVGIVALIILALLGLAVMIATLIYQAIQSNYSSEYRELAEIQQLLGQEMIGVSASAAKGSLLAARRLEEIRQLYDSTLKVLEEGDPATGLPPIPDEISSQVETSKVAWHVSRDHLGILINNARVILEVVEFEAEVRNQIPLLTASVEKIISILMESGSRPEVVYIATRQLMLAERFQNSLQQLFASSGRSVSAADQFARDVAAFGQVLDSLKNGDPALGLPKARNPLIIDELRKASDVHAAISNNIDLILESTPIIFETILALEKLEPNVGVMLDAQEELEEELEETFEEDYFLAMGLAMLAGILMISSLIIVGAMTVIRTRRSLEESTEQGRRNQRAILRLLDELTNLADGDLSAHATVSEDITGAIADSVNYAIDQLRSLVATINTTAVDVSEAASGTSTTAQGLAHSSDQQAKEIATASAAISDMATTMERVSKNAAGSADVAMKSVEIASKGADTVRLSIEGMDSIREQIQQTAKRIKRLGESSQEVGDIIGLITDIADQTNILALNAAIQASTAGEAGRGFAVVADEVQRLAERAGAATKRVEALVKTIQADTNEAVSSMEQSTAGVVTGARLAEDAGEALGEIESVSKRLAGLIQNISKEANQQAVSATNIAGSMETIRRITMETSLGTGKTAESIGNLANLSVQLKQSVAGFKLPDDSAGATGQVGVVSFEEDELLSTMMRRDDEFDQIDLGADTLIDTFMGEPGESPADDLDAMNLNADELVEQFLDVNPGMTNEFEALEEFGETNNDDSQADALVDRFLKLDSGDSMPEEIFDETIDPQADALVDQFLKQGEEDSFLETQKISRK